MSTDRTNQAVSDKLTLSVDGKVIKSAKRIAKQRGTSVSAMFSEFIQALMKGIGADEDECSQYGPLTKRAMSLLSENVSSIDRNLSTDPRLEVLLEKHVSGTSVLADLD